MKGMGDALSGKAISFAAAGARGANNLATYGARSLANRGRPALAVRPQEQRQQATPQQRPLQYQEDGDGNALE